MAKGPKVARKRKPGGRPVARSYMGAAEYRAALEQLGLNVSASARFLRVAKSTAFRRLAGTVPVPFEAAALLRLMASHAITTGEVETLMGDKP